MGRRAQFLTLVDEESRAKAAAVIGEAADCLSDGFHVTIVEDLLDIASAMRGQPLANVDGYKWIRLAGSASLAASLQKSLPPKLANDLGVAGIAEIAMKMLPDLMERTNR